jgi:hypothetical protein
MIMIVPTAVAPLIALGIKQALDGDELAVMRLAELRAAGERATAVVQWVPAGSGGFAFTVKIRRADGSLEVPTSPPGPQIINDTCVHCVHPSESHEAGRGKCFKCDALNRCARFVAHHQKGCR